LGETVQCGDLSVTLDKVTVGTIRIQVSKDYAAPFEGNPAMTCAWLTVKNSSATKKYDYPGWPRSQLLEPNEPTIMTDEFGNDYRPYPRMAEIAPVEGASGDSEIYPGKEIIDTVLFKPPVDAARTLRIQLSGSTVGLAAPICFEIPRSAIIEN
jgi:hypothetical protein